MSYTIIGVDVYGGVIAHAVHASDKPVEGAISVMLAEKGVHHIELHPGADEECFPSPAEPPERAFTVEYQIYAVASGTRTVWARNEAQADGKAKAVVEEMFDSGKFDFFDFSLNEVCVQDIREGEV